MLNIDKQKEENSRTMKQKPSQDRKFAISQFFHRTKTQGMLIVFKIEFIGENNPLTWSNYIVGDYKKQEL